MLLVSILILVSCSASHSRGLRAPEHSSDQGINYILGFHLCDQLPPSLVCISACPRVGRVIDKGPSRPAPVRWVITAAFIHFLPSCKANTELRPLSKLGPPQRHLLS